MSTPRFKNFTYWAFSQYLHLISLFEIWEIMSNQELIEKTYGAIVYDLAKFCLHRKFLFVYCKGKLVWEQLAASIGAPSDV